MHKLIHIISCFHCCLYIIHKLNHPRFYRNNVNGLIKVCFKCMAALNECAMLCKAMTCITMQGKAMQCNAKQSNSTQCLRK